MSDAAAVIAALHSGHDALASLASRLSDADLSHPTGAAEWDVSQVLGHLGSGAEIAQATLQAAVDGKPHPGMDAAKSAWARWDAMGRRERADGFGRADADLLALFDSLADRDDLRIDMGFLPAPIDVATAARLRLNEIALHSWDVRVGFDPAATLAADAAAVLAPRAGDMASFAGKPEALSGRKAVIKVTTTDPELVRALHLGEQISVSDTDPAEPDGTLSLPAEAWVRLLAGRLGPRRTPAGVTAVGAAADLGLLRRVFPGF
ncbi:MAG: maleylpyruvate isomerase family mycothiol-dependent enzyme [Nocardiopsaceae bacterium]|nr:maleylpyruvate isomerase family mycothiol-dependent enzyme [Nocardiopsaceae bacterium]